MRASITLAETHSNRRWAHTLLIPWVRTSNMSPQTPVLIRSGEERRLWLLGGYRARAVLAVFIQFYFLCRVDFALSCLLSTADSIAILVFRIFCGFPS